MKQKKNSKERRQHPRFFPDEGNLPEISFIFEDGEKISVELINISRGGLFGSTAGIEQFLEIDHHKIKTIEILPPNKEPFHCAGKLLRLHPLREDNRCFCAVEFCKIGEEDQATEPEKSSAALQIKTAKKSDHQLDELILRRAGKAENYQRLQDNKLAANARKVVYDSFADITENLPAEDRWWFFELLDEIKNREPNIPDELKQDFINICKIGLQKKSKQVKKVKLGLVKN